MDCGVFEFVLLFAVEDNAVVIYEIQNTCLPKWATQKLNQEIIFPFLRFDLKVRLLPIAQQMAFAF